LKEFLHHRRDSFIKWIESHGSKGFVDALLQLYNQIQEQLEAESDIMVDGMVKRYGVELHWFKKVVALRRKVASLEFKFWMKDEDHSRELDSHQKEIDRLQESFEEETRVFRAATRDLKKALENTEDRFEQLKHHFDRSSERVEQLENRLHHTQGDLERARDHIKQLKEELKTAEDRVQQLERENSRMATQDEFNHGLYTKSQQEVDRLTRQLRTKEADVRFLERKLEDEKLESSKWRHTAERAKRR
jgi:chromosome segregation ATPase